MNLRTKSAIEIMSTPGYCSQLDINRFKVRSQTDPEKHYVVSRTGNGLICECHDHQYRKADCKHIKVVLHLIKNNLCYRNQTYRIMERSKLKLCKFCDSGRIKKAGISKNKKGTIQRYQCKDRKRRFTTNFGFEKTSYPDYLITRALQVYYQGNSVRDIADQYEQEGIQVSYRTIYDWVSKYSYMSDEFLNTITPRVGNWYRADEIYVKIGGEQRYLFNSMDDDTRFWITQELADSKFQHDADNLLQQTLEQTGGKKPTNFITDGLPAYAKSSKKIFGTKTQHVKHIHLAGKRSKDNNNKMERLNGEIRDREKVMRGLKKDDTALMPGMRVYNNFTKKHGGLKGKTPAESAKILVDGPNKWKTIIQNASLHKRSL